MTRRAVLVVSSQSGSKLRALQTLRSHDDVAVQVGASMFEGATNLAAAFGVREACFRFGVSHAGMLFGIGRTGKLFCFRFNANERQWTGRRLHSGPSKSEMLPSKTHPKKIAASCRND